MAGLSEQDRAELAAAKRRSPNAHWIEVAVEQIVARHVAAALTEAAKAIETADYCDCRDAYCGKPRRSVAGTASVVRAQIPPP